MKIAKDIKRNVMHVLGGTILTEDFFLKNTRFMLTVFVIIVLYISNRYSCIDKMSQIVSLQRELKDAKFESLTISSELTSLSRQSRVQNLVEKNNLGLETSREPVYSLGVQNK